MTNRWKEIGQDPRPLTKNQQRVLRNLMRRKIYDANGTASVKLSILRRTFIEADYDGGPCLVLLCQVGPKDRRRFFDYVIYTDYLGGKGHVPCDSHGAGTLRLALMHFEDVIFYRLFGHHRWVVETYQARAEALARKACT